MNRRDVLEAASAALIGSAFTAEEVENSDRGRNRPLATGEPNMSTVATGINDCAGEDGVSLRCLGQQLDPDRPATRLGGHLPVEFRDPGTEIDRDLEYLIPVRPPEWIEQSESELNDDRRQTARRHARDAGMTNRRDKGLFELHRFASGRDPASLREIADRYESGAVFKLLFLNAGLFRAVGFATQYADINQRNREIGRMLREKKYDVVGLNEVWFRGQINTMFEEAGDIVWYGSPPGNDREPLNNNGLLTVLLNNDRGPTPARAKGETSESYGFYDQITEAAGLDRLVKKGWHYTEVDLGPGNIDLFVTHLNHDQEKEKYRKARLNQLDTLIEAIEDHQNEENVTILGGDLNVLGNRPEYDELAERLDRRLGLQDVWLTRGGEVSLTSYFGSHDFWPSDGPGTNPTWPPGCHNYHEGCHCDDYRHGIYRVRDDEPFHVDDNARLDYVFVERPKRSHDLRIDIKRVRRKLFPRLKDQTIAAYQAADDVDDAARQTLDCATQMAECPTGSTHCFTERYLSDHMGLELEILASEV